MNSKTQNYCLKLNELKDAGKIDRKQYQSLATVKISHEAVALLSDIDSGKLGYNQVMAIARRWS
jgi:hypothetical protein